VLAVQHWKEHFVWMRNEPNYCAALLFGRTLLNLVLKGRADRQGRLHVLLLYLSEVHQQFLHAFR
jgi:hypothetical protein